MREKARTDHDLRRGIARLVLEPALAVGQSELGGRQARLAAVGEHHVRRLEDRLDVRAVRARVRPDRATRAPGIARPNSSPLRPALCVSVAALAIGTPASAT